MKTFKIVLLISALSSFSPLACAANVAVPSSASAAAANAGVKTAAVKSQAVGTQAGTTPDGATGDIGAVQAAPQEAPTVYGLAMPIVIRPDNPPRTHTYNGIIWYQPSKWIWGNWHLYVAGRFGHWWSDGATQYRALNIYAVAPVIRYYLFKKTWFSPYVEASVGPGYLSRTQFGNRNLGMHFTFQDELGIGTVIGKEAGFYGTLSFLHYSNAALSAHNSGITVPLMLTLGYQFN